MANAGAMRQQIFGEFPVWVFSRTAKSLSIPGRLLSQGDEHHGAGLERILGASACPTKPQAKSGGPVAG